MGNGTVSKTTRAVVAPDFFPECTEKHKVKGSVSVPIKRINSLAQAQELKRQNACRMVDLDSGKWKIVKFDNPEEQMKSLTTLQAKRAAIRKLGIKGEKKPAVKKTAASPTKLDRAVSWVWKNIWKFISGTLLAVLVGLLVKQVIKNRNKGGPKGPTGSGGGGGGKPIMVTDDDIITQVERPVTRVDEVEPTFVERTGEMVAGTKRVASILSRMTSTTNLSVASSAQASRVAANAASLNKTTRTLTWRELILGATSAAAAGLSMYLLKGKSPSAAKEVARRLCPVTP